MAWSISAWRARRLVWIWTWDRSAAEGRPGQHQEERLERVEERVERERQGPLRDQADVDREIAATERELASQEAEHAWEEIGDGGHVE